MTTAHRPTFDPARGKEALRGPAYHQRLLPAHTQLKYRQPGQGGSADTSHTRDLAAELLVAEAKHFGKTPDSGHLGVSYNDEEEDNNIGRPGKRPLAITVSSRADGQDDESPEEKRRRVLAETRSVDADDSGPGSDSDSDASSSVADSDSEDDDSEDEQAELMRELERVRREKAQKREKEEAERLQVEEDARVKDIAQGNPLLNKPDFTMKRRWDDDVVFKNQARGVDDRGKPREFINDMIRSDFHKRFMGKYVR